MVPELRENILRLFCCLIERIYKEVCVLLGSSVLLLTQKNNNVTINDERSDGKWRKNQELFSLGVNHQ